jgi:hypothetical protein
MQFSEFAPKRGATRHRANRLDSSEFITQALWHLEALAGVADFRQLSAAKSFCRFDFGC